MMTKLEQAIQERFFYIKDILEKKANSAIKNCDNLKKIKIIKTPFEFCGWKIEAIYDIKQRRYTKLSYKIEDVVNEFDIVYIQKITQTRKEWLEPKPIEMNND